MSYDADLDRAQARFYAGAAWSEEGCPDCGWGRGVCACEAADRRSTVTTEDAPADLEVYGDASEDILLDDGGADWLRAGRALGCSVWPLRKHLRALLAGRTRYSRAAAMRSPMARSSAREWCSEERLALIEIVRQMRAIKRAEQALGGESDDEARHAA